MDGMQIIFIAGVIVVGVGMMALWAGDEWAGPVLALGFGIIFGAVASVWALGPV